MLPNMTSTLRRFEQVVTWRTVTINRVDFVDTEVETDIDIRAVVQVADQEVIASNNLDFSKRYLQVHTKSAVSIDDFIIYQNEKYRVVRISNYSDYGYRELVAEEVK